MPSIAKTLLACIALAASPAAAGGTITCTAKPGSSGLCDGVCTLSTTTPSKGGSFKISVNGTCSEPVSAPTFDLSIHACLGQGVSGPCLPLLSKQNLDGCKGQDFKLPLNVGEFKTTAVTGGCTHAAGEPIMIESQALVGKGSPNGKLNAEVVAKDNAGNTLFTVDVEVHLNKGEDEEAMPVRQTAV
jgi:hypothetical protein